MSCNQPDDLALQRAQNYIENAISEILAPYVDKEPSEEVRAAAREALLTYLTQQLPDCKVGIGGDVDVVPDLDATKITANYLTFYLMPLSPKGYLRMEKQGLI